MADQFWLTETQMARLRPLLPNKLRGMPRVDDRRVISGIVHVLDQRRSLVDAPAAYGPRKALYNRWVRWARQGVWRRTFEELAAAGGPSAERADARQHPRQSPPLRRWRTRGALAHAIGRSRGGRTTKLHALVDGLDRPVALAITPQASTATHQRRSGC